MKLKYFGLFLILSITGYSSDNIVAKVIYSEASMKCSSNERLLIASVIKNRIKHPGFLKGKLKSLTDVVTQKNQFSCINDKNNSNWNKQFNNKAWKEALQLSSGNFNPIDKIVLYHDKSISMPKHWNNRYWKVIKAVETKNFIFYSIIKNIA